MLLTCVNDDSSSTIPCKAESKQAPECVEANANAHCKYPKEKPSGTYCSPKCDCFRLQFQCQIRTSAIEYEPPLMRNRCSNLSRSCPLRRCCLPSCQVF